MAPRRKAPVNIATVADARARLAELAEQHPEAFRSDRLPTTEARLCKALAEPWTVVTVRLRASDREALEARAAELGTTASAFVRDLIEKALA